MFSKKLICGTSGLLLVAKLAGPLYAAEPESGTISDSSRQVEYTAGPFLVQNPTLLVFDPPVCEPNPEGQVCDFFTLNIDLPDGFAAANPDDRITISIDWDNAVNDFDMFVRDEQGNEIDRSATGGKPETVVLTPEDGQRQLTIVVEPFLVVGESFRGSIELGAPIVDEPPPAVDPGPRYALFPAPPEYGHRYQDEPSIGANWHTGKVMFQALLDTFRVDFDDATSPALDHWTRATAVNADKQSFDPILFTDHDTGRTFVSQLILGCSLMSYTDDDGVNWTPSEGCGPGAAFDHQAVGGGPFAPPMTGGTALYPNAVYYCAQDVATAKCAVSFDGGLTFGPGVTMYNLSECGGLHGHIEVAPNGVAYTPNKSCAPNQAVVVTEDNGLTWSVRRVPESTPGGTDPAIGISTDGTVYFGYQAADGTPRIAVSRDEGLSWEFDQRVGDELGVVTGVFPAVVAGDPDRAAFAFYGTPDAGNSTAADFRGNWYLYVAHTFDGGRSWATVNVTPDDPIQRGCIWEGGGGNPCRNLLDFFGIDVDAKGRVLVGYVDGCINGCVESWPNTFGAYATIARLAGGKRLFAEFDPVEPAVPGAPRLDAALRLPDDSVQLQWARPDHGGSALGEYRVYRGSDGNADALLVKLDADITEFRDFAAPAGAAYRVSAVNAVGESSPGNLLVATAAPPVPEETACILPGIRVTADPAGDQNGAPLQPYYDIESISIAEPWFGPGEDKLAFSMKMADLSVLPLETRWQINFVGQDGVQYWVNMNTESGAAPVFQYGRAGAINVVLGVGIDETLGTADAASHYSTDGWITIVVPNSVVGGSAAGDHLEAVVGVVKTEVQAADAGRGVQTQDAAPLKASYDLVGNASCKFAEAVDVTADVRLGTSDPAFSRNAASFAMDLSNISTDAIPAPLRAQVVAISSASGEVTAANADNGEPGAGAFWRYDDELGDGQLAPGETSGKRRIGFNNPRGESFSVTFRVLSGPEDLAEPEAGEAGLLEALIRISVDPLLGSVGIGG